MGYYPEEAWDSRYIDESLGVWWEPVFAARQLTVVLKITVITT